MALAEPASATSAANASEVGHRHREHIRLSHVQIDVLSGICAGIVSNIVSHPLDTVKVRMQLGSTETVKIIPTVKTIYHREGVSRSAHDYTIVDKRLLQRCPSANPCTRSHFLSVRHQSILNPHLGSSQL